MAVSVVTFTPITTNDPALNRVQVAIENAFRQVERALSLGLLGAAVAVTDGVETLTITSETFVAYIGSGGGHKIVMPSAAVNGNRTSRVIFIVNAGTGTVSVRPQADQTVQGAASLSVSAGTSAILFSDGKTQWFAVV